MATASQTGTERDTVAKAQALQPELRARADEIEAARRLPADLSARFAEAGFYAMCAPGDYGGLELPPLVTMHTIETLARADGSAAWVAFIGATSGTALALLTPETARQVYRSPATLLTGVLAPKGRAVPEGDGFRVDGRWQWGSGSENADWVLGGCVAMKDGQPERLPNGAPRLRTALVPRDQVTFLDTWHVSGLCGTGSTDFAFENLLVPAEHTFAFGVDRPLRRPLYAFPQFGLLAMGIAAVGLGLARAAIDELVGLAGGKTPQGSGRSLAERGNAQSDVARAEALLRSARAFYVDAIGRAWDVACAEGRMAVEQRRDVRLAATHTVGACMQAVDLMYHLAGGSSVYRSSPLQRIFRDVHVASQHMMVGPATFELTGRLFLGLETDASFL